jgi:hypothetical protein
VAHGGVPPEDDEKYCQVMVAARCVILRTKQGKKAKARCAQVFKGVYDCFVENV